MIQRLSADTSADTALRLAEYYAYSGDIELSFRWLNQAKKPAIRCSHSGQVTNTYFEDFLHSPFLQKLTQDVRWQAWHEYLESQIPTPVFSINTPQLVMTTN